MVNLIFKLIILLVIPDCSTCRNLLHLTYIVSINFFYTINVFSCLLFAAYGSMLFMKGYACT